MTESSTYSIGCIGQPWQTTEKKAWLDQQRIQRSYSDEVLAKILPLRAYFDVIEYGVLAYQTTNYPLFIVKSRHWDNKKKTVLITGGVHGYETSGVQGAIRFIESNAQKYTEFFNILVAPCISPWGYETINRWNPMAIDPNRSFYTGSPAEESAALMQYINTLQADTSVEIIAHIDLHETTDTDNSEFRPALAARDAQVHDNWNIPDGFYLVGNSLSPADNFQKAMIKAVEQVTHIAPADENDKLIGVPLAQFGVINYAARELGLCMGLTDAPFVTTTEVYPDSPIVDDENCILAQVACITSGLDFIINELSQAQ